MIRYGLYHKDDKKKQLAIDHWGRIILFEKEKDAQEYIDYINLKGIQWVLKETKSKTKNTGDKNNINYSYF